MENQFVTYEIAIKLEELCFDEECSLFGNIVCFIDGTFSMCNNGYKQIFSEKEYVLAPLWQQVIDWFRKKYNIQILQMCPIPPEAIIAAQGKLDHKSGHCFILYSTDWNPRLPGFDFYSEDYPKAREEAILKAIELCKKI